MNETSDEALNLLLAEYFEKKPVCKPRLPDNWEFPNPAPDQRTSKYWQFIYQGTKEFPNKWQPRSFTTDPAMTIMLISRPDFVGVMLISDTDEDNGYHAEFCSAEIHAHNCEKFGKAISDKVGRAVAEAFARAKGLI